MKKFLSILFATLCVTTLAPLAARSQEAKKSYVGVGAFAISGGLLGLGPIGKLEVFDRVSLRPFVAILSFGSASSDTYLYGISGTYDFKFGDSNLSPYAGVGYSAIGGSQTAALGSNFYVEAGADYSIVESVTINANYRYLKGGSGFGLGAAYRF
jgi:hypothetical protein